MKMVQNILLFFWSPKGFALMIVFGWFAFLLGDSPYAVPLAVAGALMFFLPLLAIGFAELKGAIEETHQMVRRGESLAPTIAYLLLLALILAILVLVR